MLHGVVFSRGLEGAPLYSAVELVVAYTVMRSCVSVKISTKAKLLIAVVASPWL